MYNNALIELDAESGTVLRTLESSPPLPLDEPTGIAATGHELWVVNHANSLLLGIDETTGTLTQKTQLSGDAASGPLPVDHQLWVAMTAHGIWHRIQPNTAKVVGTPIHVSTGLCSWASVVGHDIWSTSMPFGDFACRNGTSRADTPSGHVAELTSAAGKSLYNFARYAGSLWATDQRRTVYRVDPHTGTLTPAFKFNDRDANHLYTAFGSLWLARPGAGQLLRLGTQETRGSQHRGDRTLEASQHETYKDHRGGGF